MGKEINKHGLSRRIPDPIARVIRQRDGFGCVLCGKGIYTYEHIDPTFADATSHEPDKITLLCATHHHKVTTGMISKETVKKGQISPYCKRSGFSSDWFDYGNTQPDIHLGNNRIQGCRIPVVVNNIPFIEIKSPETPEGPVRLSAHFTDSNGEMSLSIIDNEWIANSNIWDVEIKKNSITVREARRIIHLKLVTLPLKALIIEKIDMKLYGIRFKGAGKTFSLIDRNGKSIISNNFISGQPVGMSIEVKYNKEE